MSERRGREKFSPEGGGSPRSSSHPKLPTFSAPALFALFVASGLAMAASGALWWALVALAWEWWTK